MSGPAADALAIANLKARYCASADAAAHDVTAARAGFADLFTDDFVGEFGFGPLVGGAALSDFMAEAIASGSEWMVHMLTSPRIEIDGDAATGEWAVLTYSKRRGSGEQMTVVGHYADLFRREGGTWRIARIGFTRLG